MKFNNESSMLMYYYQLAKAGSYWGKKLFQNIGNVHDLKHDRLDLTEKMVLINSTRRRYKRFKEIKENLKIYDLSIPLFLKKWLLLQAAIPYLAVPVLTLIFYLPLALLNIEHSDVTEVVPTEERFIVTKEFVDQVAEVSRPFFDARPSAPVGLKLQ